MAPGCRRGLARERVDGPRPPAQPRSRARLHRGHRTRPSAAIPPFAAQLVPGLDYLGVAASTRSSCRGAWATTGFPRATPTATACDDLYVSQPEGLPNRLFRNRGDGTFEDVTEAAGLAVLDRTSQSLFADVDNDGDQDLVLLTRGGPLLFLNDGKGRFTRDRGRLPVPAAAPGLAHLGGHGRLRPRRLPRPLPLHLRLLHRRERGQGGPALALPRRA